MNIVEGSRRMRVAGRRMVLSAGTLLACLGICGVCNALLSSPVFRAIPGFLALVGILLTLGIWVLIFGTLLWIAGWIVGGFAERPRDTHSDREQSVPGSANLGGPMQELRR